MPTMNTEKIKSVFMDAEASVQELRFKFKADLPYAKISASRLSSLAGYDNFNKQGDTALQIYGIVKGDDIDNFYTKRGWVLENALKKQLKSNGFTYIDYPENMYNIYDSNVEDEDLPREIYLSGKPDIKLPSHKVIFECKSKSLSKKEDVLKYLSFSELVQLEMYLHIEKKNYNTGFMVYGFFSDELEDRIRGLSTYEELNAITVDDIGLENIVKIPVHEVRKRILENGKKYPPVEEVILKAQKFLDDFREHKTLHFKECSSWLIAHTAFLLRTKQIKEE